MTWILKLRELLKGKKEILIEIVGALLLILTALGWMPEAMPLLGELQIELEAGNWVAAISTLISILLLLARASYRARLNRIEIEKKK